MQSSRFLVGIDIGGTFTDCAIVDRAGTLLTTKVPSTPQDFSRGMMDALGAGAQALGIGLDRFCRDNGGPQTWKFEEELDDGYVIHAPVGSFGANPFGLHDTIGNVWEWCRDWVGPYGRPVRAGDGEREVERNLVRAFRGGCFSDQAYFARSAYRGGHDPDYRFESVGVRPARALER